MPVLDTSSAKAASTLLGANPSPWFVLLALGLGLIYLAVKLSQNTAITKVVEGRFESLETLTSSVKETVATVGKHSVILERLDGTMTKLTEAIEGLKAEQSAERLQRSNLQRTIDEHSSQLIAMHTTQLELQCKILSLQESTESLYAYLAEIDGGRGSVKPTSSITETELEERRRHA